MYLMNLDMCYLSFILSFSSLGRGNSSVYGDIVMFMQSSIHQMKA